MRYYAAHATGARTRSAIRAAGLGMLGSAAYRWTDAEWSPITKGGLGWAVDNGAWSAYRAGLPFDGERFRRVALGCGAVDWIVCPDVVMDWHGTVVMRDRWLGWLLSETLHRVMLVVQNGATPREVLPFLGPRVGVFVGGDTAWKLHTMRSWADLAHSAGAHCHVGRVNTAHRVRLCRAAGADSVDGSGPAQFSDTAALVAAGLTGPLQTAMSFTWRAQAD